MQLTIDDQLCDLCSKQSATISYDSALLTDVTAARSGSVVRLALLPTSHNARIMGFAEDVNGGERFNAAQHTACLTADGSTIICGVACIESASATEGYTLRITDGGAQWAEDAALATLAELPLDFSTTLTPQSIKASWTGRSVVRFLPVSRDSYTPHNSTVGLFTPERIISTDDYYPFVGIVDALRAIFEKAGYTLVSRFLDSPLPQSLLLRGAYRRHSDAAAKQRNMGFCAVRSTTTETIADAFGRVYASPAYARSSVGNIVDTTDPTTLYSDGTAATEAFDNGGTFGTDAYGYIYFRPTVSLSAGFEYRLKYVTEYRIADRHTLTGFDTIYLGTSSEYKFTLANRFDDCREQLIASTQYRLVIFDYSADDAYTLAVEQSGQNYDLGTFYEPSALVTMPSGGAITACELYHTAADGTVELFDGDWAMYLGYVEYEGLTEVEVTVHSAAEELSPSSPKSFRQIYFGGAEQGMTFRLLEGCSVQPSFDAQVGCGAQLTMPDMLCIDARQLTFIDAVRQMFNLQIYTDTSARRVYIEPFDDFFGFDDEPLDWSGKIDMSQSICVSDTGIDEHQYTTLCYIEGAGEVARFNSSQSSDLGSWTHTNPSFISKEGAATQRNPLFRSSMTVADFSPTAPSAEVVSIGDRDADDEPTDSTEVVCYSGLQPLPDGQIWGSPHLEASYPMATFYHTATATAAARSLCFEERDGIAGLHTYYDRALKMATQGRRVELSLRLTPRDIAELLSGESCLLRRKFRLQTHGDEAEYLLCGIDRWSPSDVSTRCSFIKIVL